MPAPFISKAAPDFELDGIDGKQYGLTRSLTPEPLFLVFFKVSCPTCQFTVPYIERLYQQIGERCGRVWGISQDAKEDSERFARQFGLSFPILLDEKPYAMSRQYGVKFVPALFLIAPDQTIQAAWDGFSKPDLEETQKYLGAHFSINPPPLFQPGEHVPQYKPG